MLYYTAPIVIICAGTGRKVANRKDDLNEIIEHFNVSCLFADTNFYVVVSLIQLFVLLFSFCIGSVMKKKRVETDGPFIYVSSLHLCVSLCR